MMGLNGISRDTGKRTDLRSAEVACSTGLAIETGGGGFHDGSHISHLGIQVYIDATNQGKGILGKRRLVGR